MSTGVYNSRATEVDYGIKALITCFVAIISLIVVIISKPLPMLAQFVIGTSIELVATVLLKTIVVHSKE
jgi:hypothetical protein